MPAGSPFHLAPTHFLILYITCERLVLALHSELIPSLFVWQAMLSV